MVLMTAKHVRHLPVFEDSRFLGVNLHRRRGQGQSSPKSRASSISYHDYIFRQFG